MVAEMLEAPNGRVTEGGLKWCSRSERGWLVGSVSLSGAHVFAGCLGVTI